MNLTVQNGYPIKDFDQGRDGEELDMQEVASRWYSLGLELAEENGVEAQYTLYFNTALAAGSHPQICYEIALSTLGIEYEEDTFFVTYKNETSEI